MTMTSRAFHATRLACALAALGLSLSAHAQYRQNGIPCVDGPMDLTAVQDTRHGDAGPAGCIGPLSDNRAAVLLPSSLEEIDRVPTDASLRRHAWGFIDANGKLAVEPQFERVGDFHHGLAAVRWKGKWGYIDAKGKMAVPPRYDSASDFVEGGLAVVTVDGRYQLIDRAGKAVGDAIDASVDSVRLGEGKPARLSITYREEFRSTSGERRYAKPGVQVISSYGDGLFIGVDNHGMHGLLDGDWNWRVAPQYSDISRLDRNALALGIGEEEVVLIDPAGKVIGEGKRYERIKRVGKAFWSAQLPRGKGYALLDAAGQPLGALTAEEAQSSEIYDNTLVYVSGDTLKAYVAGRAEPVALGSGMRPEQNEEGYLLFRDQAGQVAGLLTPKGAWLHGDSAPPWLADVGRMTLRQGKLWLSGQDGQLLNALDADGRAILQPDALAAAQGAQLRDLPLNVPGGPLGLLGQGYCHCNDGGAGLVLADGSVATHKDWTEVVPLDEPRDDYATDEEAEAAPLGADDLRFAAQTEAGVQLLDGRGKPMDLPPQQHIGAFHQGYALIYNKGQTRLIDRGGKVHALPDYFEAQVVAPGLVRYLKTAAEGDPWGLYDFIAGKEVSPPAFQYIGEFQHGQAAASLGAGKAGVIDQQGKWVVPPRYHAVKRVSDKLWLVQQPGPQENEYRRPTALVNRDGRVLTAFQPALEVSREANGTYLAYSEKQRWLVSPDASGTLDLEDASYTQMGDWLAIRRADRHGYVDGQGRWQVAPGPVAGTRFQGTPARALVSGDDGARLIDEHGKTVVNLPAGQWDWPAGSAWLMRHGSDDNGKPTTTYVDATGKTRLTLAGDGTAFSEGQAALALPNGGMRAINDKGAASGPTFAHLGPRRNGLSVAAVGERYGYADGQGRMAIAPVYLWASDYAGQRAVVSTREQSLILDERGAMVARVTLECGIRTLYGAYNQRLWPLSMPQHCRR